MKTNNEKIEQKNSDYVGMEYEPLLCGVNAPLSTLQNKVNELEKYLTLGHNDYMTRNLNKEIAQYELAVKILSNAT